MGSGSDETWRRRMYMSEAKMDRTTPATLVQHVELVGWKAADNGGYWVALLHAL